MTNTYVVVDTDVFSNLWQGTGDVAAYQRALKNTVPVLSFTSVAEVYYGAYATNWGERRMRQLEAAIRRYLIVPYDVELAKLWGRLKAQARGRGHPLHQNVHSNDLWICATAIRHDARLLTGNRRHFEDVPNLDLVEVEA